MNLAATWQPPRARDGVRDTADEIPTGVSHTQTDALLTALI